MSKKNVSTSELESMNGALARYLTQRLESATAIPDDEDDFVVPLATGEVANMIALLKMNNIMATPTEEDVSALRDEFADSIEAQRIAKANNLLSASPEELERASWLGTVQ